MKSRTEGGCGVSVEQLACSLWGEELGQHTARYLKFHEQTCPACAREADQMREVVRALRTWQDETPPFYLVFTEADADNGPEQVRPPEAQVAAGAGPLRTHRARWTAAAAAAACVGVAVAGFMASNGSPDSARAALALEEETGAQDLVTARQLEAYERRTAAHMDDLVDRLERVQRDRTETILAALTALTERQQDGSAVATPFQAAGDRSQSPAPATATADANHADGAPSPAHSGGVAVDGAGKVSPGVDPPPTVRVSTSAVRPGVAADP